MDELGKLENLSHAEIIKNIILLKGGGAFNLDKFAGKLEGYLGIPKKNVHNTISLNMVHLSGESNSPFYKLSEKGKKIYQEEFDEYSPRVQKELRKIAEKIWD